ncbi:MAG: conjugative transposon protein TraM [Chitinophagaceae bacterium]
MEQQHKLTPTLLRQRKLLLVLPFLALPFMTLLFWSLGGGKGNAASAQGTEQKGLNVHLPDAKLKTDKELNKLSFYEQAALDSAKLKEEKKLDPYWNQFSSNPKNDTAFSLNNIGHKNANEYSLPQIYNNRISTSPYSDNNMDPNEAKVYSKLQQLNNELNKSAQPSASTASGDFNNFQQTKSNYDAGRDVDKLEKMMNAMKQSDGSDPEMQQLNSMLDKILAVQHPEAFKDSAQQEFTKDQQQNLSVTKIDDKTKISLLTKNKNSTTKANNLNDYNDTVIDNRNENNGFYSFTSEPNISEEKQNAIAAIVPETQTLVSGSTVKLLLSDDVSIKGLTVPKNTFVYGTASLNDERLKITINSIRFQQNILPVSLEVYDLDGLAGIYIPGSISRDVAKQSADQGINSIGITTLDPSIAAQATSAGIQAAKTLISKKVKLTKITIREGYQVLLKDNTQKQ